MRGITDKREGIIDKREGIIDKRTRQERRDTKQEKRKPKAKRDKLFFTKKDEMIKQNNNKETRKRFQRSSTT